MTDLHLRHLHQPRWQGFLRTARRLGGYWGKQGPEFLDHRLAAYDGEQRMIFGATTFGLFVQMLPAIGDERDPWMDRMPQLPHHRRLVDAAGPLRVARRDRC